MSDWDIHEPGFTTVAVLALTPDERVVLTRQFRPGPGRVVFDLPGGIVDPLGGVTSSWGGDEYCEPVLRSLAEFREILRTGETTEADVGYVALDAAGLL